MEVKAVLNKPYTDKERMDFIVEYNHQKGYEIRETAEALEAWGETSAEILADMKARKYDEANTKAFQYLESGEALFEYEEGKSIEATDGNIAKLGLALVNFILQQDYESTIDWNTKENENVQLNAETLQVIVTGLRSIQSYVWTAQFPAFLQAIEEAETIEEVEAIEIVYTDELPEVEEEPVEE